MRSNTTLATLNLIGNNIRSGEIKDLLRALDATPKLKLPYR
jgi:hypothetical protein